MTILAALRCADLVPPSYREPIHGVPPLRKGATVGDLGDALDGQTERLDQANGRTADVIALTEACDRRSAEVAQQLKPRKSLWPF